MSLPTIEMPKKEQESKIISEDLVDEINYDSSSGEESEEEDQIVQGAQDPKVTEEEVFNPPKIKEAIEDTYEDPVSEEVPPKKMGKRAYNRKKPMSQKQLDHLAKIRLIGVEKRKERAKEAREKKLLDQEDQAEERLLKKKEKAEEKKIVENFKKEREYKENKLQQDYEKQRPKEVQTGYFTKEDLDNAVLSAVETYDVRRKKEKRTKKLKEKEEAVKQKKIDTIQNAIQPQQAPVQDQWRHLFS